MAQFTPQNPDFRSLVTRIFEQANFITDVGIQLVDMGAGWVETELIVKPKHLQQNQIVHAGVQATMADHTAGATAGTLVASDDTVLTVEFKINLLRPAIGEKLFCRAEMLKAGKAFSVVESQVFMVNGEQHKLASKATVTLAIVKQVSA